MKVKAHIRAAYVIAVLCGIGTVGLVIASIWTRGNHDDLSTKLGVTALVFGILTVVIPVVIELAREA